MRTFVTLSVLALALVLPSAALRAQGNLFSSNYLTGGPTNDTAADLMPFEEYVNSLSFDSFVAGLGNNGNNGTTGSTTPELGTGTTTGSGSTGTSGTGTSGTGTTGTGTTGTGTTGSGSTNGTTGETDLTLLDETIGNGTTTGSTDMGPPTTITPDSAYYWRAWGQQGDLRANIQQGTYQTPAPITVDGQPWSYTYWPMKTCELAFARFPVVDGNAITDPTKRGRGFENLSAMEAYDTWVYNTTGRLPGAAALEAHSEFHNKAPLCVRRTSPDSQELAYFWIVSSALKLDGGTPLSFRTPDGRAPVTGVVPTIGQSKTYTLALNGASVQVTARIRDDVDGYFPNKIVEEFAVPYDAVKNDSRFALKGTDDRHAIYRFDDQGEIIRTEDGGYAVAGTFSWNDIQRNEQLRRQHLRAKDPETIPVYRLISATGQTQGWYYLEHTLKPGFSHYGWWGHCNGWSAASIRVPAPATFPVVKNIGKPVKLVRLKKQNAIDTMDADGRQLITMSSDDYDIIETNATELRLRAPHYFGIATCLWQDCNTAIRNTSTPFYGDLGGTDPTGNRYWGDDRSSESDEYLSDIYPNHFFTLLMFHIKERREGIVCDTNRGLQVWNAPVRGFRYRHTWVPTPQDPINLGYYDLVLNVDYVPYGGLWDYDTRAKFSVASGGKDYRAKLLVDSKGRVYRGEWLNADGVTSITDHPDFAWLPVDPTVSYVRSQNGRVTDANALQFLGLSR